jgi:hypothetical protein
MGLIIELTGVYIWLGSMKEKIVLWLIQKTVVRYFMPIFKRPFKGLNKHLDNINHLRSELDKLNKYPFNTSHEHYLSYIDNSLRLVNFSKFPRKIEHKITIYNKKADNLSDLLKGCDYLVKDMIIKNSLEHLHEIEIIKDDKNQVIEWKLGDREAKLSKLLSYVLKNRILKDEKIDKPLFDSIDSTFYIKITQESMNDAFDDFLRNLNRDIEFQKNYGCLKLFKRWYSDTEELVDDLLNEVNKYKH